MLKEAKGNRAEQRRIWLSRGTMPGRCRSTPIQVSVSSKCVMAAYRLLTAGN